MIKNVSKKITLLLFTLVFSITSVNAASTYTVTNVKEDTSSPMILKGTQAKYHNAATLTTWKFVETGETVYCTTPGATAPKANDTYEKVSLDATTQKALDSLCSQTKDVNSYERGAILKLAGVKYLNEQIANSDSAAYTEFFAGTSEYIGPSFSNTEVKNMIENAKTATTGTTNVSATQNGNSITLKTKVATTITVSDGYTLKVKGSKTNSNTYTTNATNTIQTYAIEVVEPNNGDINATVTITYDQKDAGTSTSTASYYKNTKNGNQNGISCNDNGASNKCDAGFNESGSNCQTTFTITETGTKITCPDTPTYNITPSETSNTVCNLNGTVLEVKENVMSDSVSPTDNDIKCLINQKNYTDATELAYGNDNSYCKVYCTENINMNLPGPDTKNTTQTANGENSTLFINAGSFFTIEGDMKQEDTVSCYSVFDYETYESTIAGLRNAVVEAYNSYSEIKATKSASSEVTDPDTGTKTCELTGTTTYQTLTMDSTGKITQTTSTLTNPDCSISDSEVSSKKTALDSAITSAKSGIEAAQTKLAECSNFDDGFNKILDKIKGDECDSTIEFSYADSPCGNYKLKESNVENDTITGNIKKASTSKVNVGVCDASGQNCNKDDSYELIYYISKQTKVTTTYEFDNDFTINLKTGEVSCDATTGDEYSDVYKGFPVKSTAIQAEYLYEYEFSGIGHDLSSSTCQAGRFDNKLGNDNSYGCYFNVNSCKQCNIICKGDNCTYDDGECDDECKVNCVGGGCIVDGNGGLLATYKTISLNSEFAFNAMSQNKTEMLALANTNISNITSSQTNSKVSSTTSSVANGSFSNWTTDKGIDAQTEIVTSGESIYDQAEYSVTLTPEIMEKVREYNSTHGAYAISNDASDTDLSCTKFEGQNYGVCTSSFIHNNTFLKFTINNDSVTGAAVKEINGAKFATYAGDTDKEFVGPAWK